MGDRRGNGLSSVNPWESVDAGVVAGVVAGAFVEDTEAGLRVMDSAGIVSLLLSALSSATNPV
jgi:hypothetical protein